MGLARPADPMEDKAEGGQPPNYYDWFSLLREAELRSPPALRTAGAPLYVGIRRHLPLKGEDVGEAILKRLTELSRQLVSVTPKFNMSKFALLKCQQITLIIFI